MVSFKKKVFKYATPKPREASSQELGLPRLSAASAARCRAAAAAGADFTMVGTWGLGMKKGALILRIGFRGPL